MLSRYLAQPRTGHLVHALHILKYLDQHKNNEIASEPEYYNVEDPAIVQYRIKSMKEMYPDADEDMPLNYTPHQGNHVEINCFVEGDSARDKVTQRSKTGTLLYLNSAPIVWYSKCQNTIESSTFGSEFALPCD